MKKIYLLSLIVMFPLLVLAQKAVISFEEKTHDFGKINEEDGKATYVFTFENKGIGELNINRVQASCGCTTPTWTKEPIEPGKKGSITVTYNPTGRPGPFTKTITVFSNASQEQEMLIIKGEVIPKQGVDAQSFPVVMDGLALKSKVVQMNNIDRGKTQVRTLSIKNTSKSDLRPTIEHLPPYLTAEVSPATLKHNEEGKVTFAFDSKKCPLWGPVSDEVYVALNGQTKVSDEFKLVLISNIVEDFGKLTLDQKQKSPILEMSEKNINLGTISAGGKQSGKFKVRNSGINKLEIRRLINNNKEFEAKIKKTSISGGKSADISIDLNTQGLTEGDYKKTITLQTNDPENSFILLIVSWKIVK